VHVNKIVVQGLQNTMDHSLSKFEPRWDCGSDPNLPIYLAYRLFPGICLADGTFGNSISSSIVRYCVCMSVLC
jgi:hypothetical protein